METMQIGKAKKLVRRFDPVEGFVLEIWKNHDKGVREFGWSPFAFRIEDMAGHKGASSRMLLTRSPHHVDDDNAYDIDAVQFGEQAPRYETQADATKEGFTRLGELVGGRDAQRATVIL
jgi:hypothetical protein